MPLRLLLTQHLFAAAARLLLQRGANRQSGRSLVPISPEPILLKNSDFRENGSKTCS
jgi:hypothetical protein